MEKESKKESEEGSGENEKRKRFNSSRGGPKTKEESTKRSSKG